MSGDPQEDRFVCDAPEPSTDAVLAVGFNLQLALPSADGLLDLFLEDARAQAFPTLFGGNDMHGFGTAALLGLVHMSAPGSL
jgi:hypothetical protein